MRILLGTLSLTFFSVVFSSIWGLWAVLLLVSKEIHVALLESSLFLSLSGFRIVA